MTALDAAAQDRIFRTARTHNGWTSEPISDAQIQAIYDLMKFGPTSANGSPARFVWLKSDEAKARVKPYLSAGNHKALKASVIAIIGYDTHWNERLPELFPHAPGAKDWYGDAASVDTHGFRNGTLQGAYLIIAARALGFDVGPFSGFDFAGVDQEFFAGTTIKVNFMAAIGHGTDENLFPRGPRLSFSDANTIL
ncbi:MAG TPA: malonic semialdehyde reductase [Caulobacteraceae bacterium]|nr:malonic semialdehyde reductase [Caulobacteraceae bacterium]